MRAPGLTLVRTCRARARARDAARRSRSPPASPPCSRCARTRTRCCCPATSPTRPRRRSTSACATLLAPLPMPVHVLPGNHDDRDALRAHFPLDGERRVPLRRRASAACGWSVCDSTVPGRPRAGSTSPGSRRSSTLPPSSSRCTTRRSRSACPRSTRSRSGRRTPPRSPHCSSAARRSCASLCGHTHRAAFAVARRLRRVHRARRAPDRAAGDRRAGLHGASPSRPRSPCTSRVGGAVTDARPADRAVSGESSASGRGLAARAGGGGVVLAGCGGGDAPARAAAATPTPTPTATATPRPAAPRAPLRAPALPRRGPGLPQHERADRLRRARRPRRRRRPARRRHRPPRGDARAGSPRSTSRRSCARAATRGSASGPPRWARCRPAPTASRRSTRWCSARAADALSAQTPSQPSAGPVHASPSTHALSASVTTASTAPATRAWRMPHAASAAIAGTAANSGRPGNHVALGAVDGERGDQPLRGDRRHQQLRRRARPRGARGSRRRRARAASAAAATRRRTPSASTGAQRSSPAAGSSHRPSRFGARSAIEAGVLGRARPRAADGSGPPNSVSLSRA